MAHGLGMTRWHGLEPLAEAFSEAGFAVLVHDHRNFGASGGEEPGDIDPWRQIADWRYAVSYLEHCEEVDPDRIGLWGYNLAGGHALVLAATDRRIRAVVAQAPTTSGYEQFQRRISPDVVEALEARFADDDRRRLLGEEVLVQKIASSDPHILAAYRSPEAVAFYDQQVPDDRWSNRMTLRSARAARMYEPGLWVARVAPTPLMLIVSMQDTMTMTDLALSAYERALQPKRLVMVRGSHFSAFSREFTTASGAATRWFAEHLRPA